MKELREEVKQAYELLCAVFVRGDDVEAMAGAKECLRRAYRLAGENREDSTDGR